MNASQEWEDYLAALHALSDAPSAGDTRRQRIDADLATARRTADAERDQAAAARRQLDEQLARVRTAADQVIADDAIPQDGPAAAVVLPPPGSVAEARSTLTRLERQLAADQRALAEARNQVQQRRARRQRQLRLLLIAAGALLLIIVVIALTVG